MTAAAFGSGENPDAGARTAGPNAALCVGSPRFADGDLAAIARSRGQPAAWTAAFARFGIAAPAHASGDFAVAVSDETGKTLLAVDRFATRTLCYRQHEDRLHVAARADDLGDAEALDPQALFDYLYFHAIPAPRTVYRDVRRLPAGHCALFDRGTVTVAPYWQPAFDEGERAPLAQLRDEFRELLEAAVAAELDGRGEVGCFLSGGTDSSTVAGLVGRITQSRARTFSIGFDVPGYDEIEYARIAARHFGTEHHEHYMKPDDLVATIPKIAAACDQPFGNSSIAPVYHCAAMAREAGVRRMLGGDGGDELFAGNARYARQRVFALYARLPRPLREAFLEPLLRMPGAAAIPGVRKAVRYVEQARAPMPDRLELYNLLLRPGPAQVLTAEFLDQIDPELPLREQRARYAECAAGSLVNRMLAYDWKYTLAENDLPKVVTGAAMAGIEVGFPLLDDRLVAFSARLDPALKLKGLALRWFFKDALRDFLPTATLAKKKHGFGMPFGVWLTQHRGLRALAQDSLALLRDRKIVRADFLDRLVAHDLPQAPGYYGEMVWILMMLAQWEAAHRRRLPQ